MTTNLLTQYNYNKGKVILAIPECYSAFKTNIESAINSKQDLDLDTMSDNGMDNTPYVNINGIAILDFQGFTVSSCSPLEAAFFGLVSLQDFCEDLTEAIEDESVTTVIINFDSGGGYTSYGEETCELLQTLKEVKPIYAYTSGLMCSMAYKIACNCNNIIASPSAIVGSIGTYCEYVTYNGASELSDTGVTVSNLADLGITVTTFQGGTQKTVGSPAIALTKEQKQSIMNDIQDMTTEFRNMVKANRGDVKDEFLQGQPFYAKEAIEKGTNLIDGCENSLKQFIQFLLTQTN